MTVQMTRDGKCADVHLDEVENWTRCGWEPAEIEVEVYKSAETGRMISKAEAEANPKETYKTKVRKKK
jgi:uncharacterized protein YjhX (UPF0386 family)